MYLLSQASRFPSNSDACASNFSAFANAYTKKMQRKHLDSYSILDTDDPEIIVASIDVIEHSWSTVALNPVDCCDVVQNNVSRRRLWLQRVPNYKIQV